MSTASIKMHLNHQPDCLLICKSLSDMEIIRFYVDVICREAVLKGQRVVPCLGEKSGDLQRCEVRSASGLGATSCTGLTCMSASFLRHCSLFLIIDCMELSFSVTMKICDWRHTAKGEESVQTRTYRVGKASATVPAAAV